MDVLSRAENERYMVDGNLCFSIEIPAEVHPRLAWQEGAHIPYMTCIHPYMAGTTVGFGDPPCIGNL